MDILTLILSGLAAVVAGFLLGRWDLRSWRAMHRKALLGDLDALNRALMKADVRLTSDLVRELSILRADITDLT